jgi:transcriptional regulator with PAS, ATPase and Fis domain
LDEVAELRTEMQVKLLRVLQDKKFLPVGGTREVRSDARVIAATNQNLEKMIEDGSFREDLFYRLNVMPIFLPPLRDRLDDLPDLTQFFIRKYNKRHGKNVRGLAPEALETMRNYRWPGNIRELENAIEHAFVISNGDVIHIEALPENILRASRSQVEIKLPQNYVGPLDYDRFKEEAEKEFIVRALKSNQGKINKTVAHASIPKNTLLRKIKKYNIDVKALIEESNQE